MNYKKILTVGALAVISISLNGCRTVPEHPETLTCSELNSYADTSFGDDVPFFAPQLRYPGDWRKYAPLSWVKNDSRKRVLYRGVHYMQIEALTISAREPTNQSASRVRVRLSQCRNALNRPEVQMISMSYREDDPASFVRTQTVNLKGHNPEDELARLACGYKTFPPKTNIEKMGQLWKQCQQPSFYGGRTYRY